MREWLPTNSKGRTLSAEGSSSTPATTGLTRDLHICFVTDASQQQILHQ